MALLVRDTVAVAVGNAVEEVCAGAQPSAATAKIKAKKRLFKVFSNLGETERFLTFPCCGMSRRMKRRRRVGPLVTSNHVGTASQAVQVERSSTGFSFLFLNLKE